MSLGIYVGAHKAACGLEAMRSTVLFLALLSCCCWRSLILFFCCDSVYFVHGNIRNIYYAFACTPTAWTGAC